MDYFAYLDPGTGSLFLQAVIGGILGAIFVMRNFIITTVYKIKSIFKREAVEAKDTTK